MKTNIILTDRDVKVIKEIQRWRFLLSRQIKVLCGFPSQRTCDRRVSKLINAGFLEKRKYIYGVPSLYFITRKAVRFLDLEYYSSEIRIEQIYHDISVVDTAIYLIRCENVDTASIVTERQLRHKAGFGNMKHFPDVIYKQDEKSLCVEIELSAKKLTRLEKNIKNNFKIYDVQRWFVPSDRPKIIENINSAGKQYDVEIIPLERVKDYVGKL